MKKFEEFNIFIPPTASGEYYTTCPQCSDQRKKKKVKCLSVNVEKGVWICHHCGWRGGLDKGASYSDPFWNKPDYRKPRLLKDRTLPDKVINYFIKRGIYEDILTKYRITVDKVYMPQCEDFVIAIGFPYFQNGEHVNTKWRDAEKHFRQEAGARKILFGLDDIHDAETVIWVEGEMDKLSLAQVGTFNVVSVPDGAPPEDARNYTSKFQFLENCEEQLQDKEHILFLDSDGAGRKLEEELARRLGKENCKRIRLPDGVKDANEYLLKYGSIALKELIETAQPYPVSGIHQAEELTEGVISLHDHGLQRGVSTGWVALNYYYTVALGQMTIVTGIPNHGKSNWLDCLTLNIATEEDWRFGVFSPENQPLERHAAGLLEKRFS